MERFLIIPNLILLCHKSDFVVFVIIILYMYFCGGCVGIRIILTVFQSFKESRFINDNVLLKYYY